MINQQKKRILRDPKLFSGIFFVIASFVAAKFGTVLFFVKYNVLEYRLAGAIIYALSWILFFLGVLLVGFETINLARKKINENLKKSVKSTYDYTLRLHHSGIKKITKSSKKIAKRFGAK